jgi:hypothetical protein
VEVFTTLNSDGTRWSAHYIRALTEADRFQVRWLFSLFLLFVTAAAAKLLLVMALETGPTVGPQPDVACHPELAGTKQATSELGFR